MKYKATVIYLSLIISTFGIASEIDSHLQLLHKDVKTIGIAGSPGQLCVFGEKSFVVIPGGEKDAEVALVAATQYDKGRIIAFGHNGYLTPKTMEQADTLTFTKNCINWSAGIKDEPVVGVYQNKKLTAYLKKQEINAQNIGLDKIAKIDCIIISAGKINKDNIAVLKKHVSQGKGLITAGTGWGWIQLNKGKSLARDFAANQLLVPMGLVFANGMAKKTANKGYLAKTIQQDLLNASKAFDIALANSKTPKKIKPQAKQISSTLSLAIRSLPENDKLLLPKIQNVEKEFLEKTVPTAQKPLKVENMLGRLFVTRQTIEIQKIPAESVQAHPAADSFPGLTPKDAPRINKTIEIDTSIPRWHSTGLYAPAGEKITVRINSSTTDKKLKVRIGCHKDKIWRHDKWKRFPEITRVFALDKTKTIAANAFGGLIYIEVPKECKAGKINVRIESAVKAPYYIHGKTAVKDWNERIKSYPAPWAELASDKIIITVPSENIRELDDPASLMEVWNKILDACAELATIDKNRTSPERIVPDLQISVGYMHAGYPIMTHADQYTKLADKEHLLKGSWGLFHEIGHNHQNRDWTFAGTGEVTVNLFTTYVFDKVCGTPPLKGRMTAEKRNEKIKKYIANGRKYDNWKSDPFLALTMYMQLQEEFGWAPFKKVFAEYRELEKDQRPKTDDDKRDQWMVRFSKQVGKNLGPFFDAWNVPVSQKAKNEIKNLPVWLPNIFQKQAVSTQLEMPL